MIPNGMLLRIAWVLLAGGTAPPGSEGHAATQLVVERGPFEVTLELDGVFVEPEAQIVRSEAKRNARVVEALSAGWVDRGDVLVRLQSDALDEAVQRKEFEQAQAQTNLELRREERDHAETAIELQVLATQARALDARRALDELLSIDVPQRLQNSERNVEQWDERRREQEEMFAVLVRMYEADGVIETRERMDIESQRRALERDPEARSRMIARNELLKNVTIPAEIAAQRHALRQAELQAELARATARFDLAAKQAAVQQAERTLRHTAEQLAELRRGQDALVVRAPIDGYAIAGQYDDAWRALGETERRLRPGTDVAPGQTLFTLVPSAPKRVRASVPEHVSFAIRPEHPAMLVPTSLPNVALRAHVEQVGLVPVDGRIGITLRADVRHERLFPGSHCRVRLTLRDEPHAITVPSNAIERVGGMATLRVREGTLTVRRTVRVGLTHAGRTEVLQGLEAGDVVLVK